jgi:mono/diheme cytochrome c family protein
MRVVLVLSFCFACLLLPAFSTSGKFSVPPAHSVSGHVPADSLAEAQAFYVDYCATCHGDQWEGGLAKSLADGKWQFGDSDSEIARVIREGIDDEGMPGWKDVLTDRQVQHLVQLIRSMERDRVRARQ